MKAKIEVIGGPADGKEFLISKTSFIGRETTCEVAIAEDRFISKKHAVLRMTNAGYHLEDLDSTNGSFIDGIQVHKPMLLNHNQIFKVGTTLLQIRYE